ncbi:MAG: hypothetical protein GY819_07885 [Planctomycetaceae bacterium]|nr:hypothetical protein [Planctomycetaceae bacterium]MCP4462701.1 hypothetical protein [Planctomycetaceae bacterium]
MTGKLRPFLVDQVRLVDPWFRWFLGDGGSIDQVIRVRPARYRIDLRGRDVKDIHFWAVNNKLKHQ